MKDFELGTIELNCTFACSVITVDSEGSEDISLETSEAKDKKANPGTPGSAE